MRIKFKETHKTLDKTYEKGQEYEVENDRRAMMWVKSGIATATKTEIANADAPAGEVDAAAAPAVATGGKGKK